MELGVGGDVNTEKSDYSHKHRQPAEATSLSLRRGPEKRPATHRGEENSDVFDRHVAQNVIRLSVSPAGSFRQSSAEKHASVALRHACDRAGYRENVWKMSKIYAATSKAPTVRVGATSCSGDPNPPQPRNRLTRDN